MRPTLLKLPLENKKVANFQVVKDPSQVVETVSIMYLYELSCLLSFNQIN